MSVDVLQDKIRKTKNPSVLLLEAEPALVPPAFQSEESVLLGLERYFSALLEGVKGTIPAVRFGFAGFAAMGAEGLQALSRLMVLSRELGFYVLMDLPEMFTPVSAQLWAAALTERKTYACDGVVIGSYLGTDALQPMRELCKKGISVFAVIRTSNKSAVELQDLLTGGRHVHTAAADVVNRHGEAIMGKRGYSQMGAVAAASSAESLRTLRSKYSRLFLLLDGYDYPNANAKNCSYAFDKFGHGAVACACASVVGAWREVESCDADAVALAHQAAERMRKNLTRYISVL